MFPMRLFLFAIVAAMSRGKVYKFAESYHATTPILERPSLSVLMCAALCDRHGDCTHWSRDDNSLCSLYPPVSASTATTGTLYGPPPRKGYISVRSSSGKMFGIHFHKTIKDANKLAAACRKDGSGVTSAFPEDDEQMSLLRNTTAQTPADFLWIGLYTDSYRYFSWQRKKYIPIKPEWMTPKEAEKPKRWPCFKIGKDGIQGENCLTTQGYICEERP